MPDPVAEPVVVESKEHEAKEEAALEEIKEAVVADNPNVSDEVVDKIADKVYDRIKKFTEELITAAGDAAEVVAEMAPIESAPPPPAEPEVPPEDVKPQRRHGLFSQPFKRT